MTTKQGQSRVNPSLHSQRALPILMLRDLEKEDEVQGRLLERIVDGAHCVMMQPPDFVTEVPIAYTEGLNFNCTDAVLVPTTGQIGTINITKVLILGVDRPLTADSLALHGHESE